MAAQFAAEFSVTDYQPGAAAVTVRVGRDMDSFVKKAGQYTVTDQMCIRDRDNTDKKAPGPVMTTDPGASIILFNLIKTSCASKQQQQR